MTIRGEGKVAIVLHAHLPYVRSDGGEEEVEERWLHEVLWECYLPLLTLLEHRAARSASGPPVTLSLSPTLLAMLGDPHHRAGFDAFTGTLGEIGARAARIPELRPAATDHLRRLEASTARWGAARRDLTRAFVELSGAGGVELLTTAATHAYLPSVLLPSTTRAQLRIGQRYFRASTGLTSRGLWLPECGYQERLSEDLTRSGAEFVVVEQLGLELARPTPPGAPLGAVVAGSGLVFFGRAADLVGRVWSRERGYPGHAAYREFHRDLADVAPATLPAGFVGPTGIRPLRVTGSEPKAPYDPAAASELARSHAREFASILGDALAASTAPDPIAVLAFDAELFGHWWWEGPVFLEALLEALGDRAVSLSGYLERDPALAVAEPAPSSWGDGGFSEVWTHPAAAHAVRVGHRAERRVAHVDSLVRDTPRAPVQRDARLWAIRELLQLQASDYPFMLRVGESVSFAERRLREHARNVDLLTEVAARATPMPSDAGVVAAIRRRRPLFTELDEDALADALDPFEA